MSLAGVKIGRCGFCGWYCDGATCPQHRDVALLVDADVIVPQTAAQLSPRVDPEYMSAYDPRMHAADDREAVTPTRERDE